MNMMYDELVRDLHESAEWAVNTEAFAIPKLLVNKMRKAADAIEELARQNAKWEKIVLTALDFIPCWIPVTERLPEDGSDILAYHAVDSRITAANYYKRTWQDCVMGRLYLTEEGFITHWMPLPEPPKKEA